MARCSLQPTEEYAMDAMALYALIWAINIFTPCKRRAEFDRLTELVTFIVRESEKHFSKHQVALIVLAMMTSAKWHGGVYRDDGITPYIIHPFEVVEALFKIGIYDFELTLATIYHDVVEDEKDNSRRWRKRQTITKKHGNIVRGTVELVTKAQKTEPKKRAAFFHHLRTARRIQEAWRAQILKLVDAETNARTYEEVFDTAKVSEKVEENDREYPPVAKALEANLRQLIRAGKLPRDPYWNLAQTLLDRLMTTLKPYRT